jgi:hypothetical protein
VRLASLPAAAVAARVSSGNLPISSSCVDLLARAAAGGGSGATAAGSSSANNSSNSSSSNHAGGGPFSGGGAPVPLPPTAAASAVAASAAAASGISSSSLPPPGRLSKEGSCANAEAGQQQQQQRLQVQVSLSTPGPSLGLAELQAHQQAARASAVSHIRGMPDKPLVVLQRMVELMKVGRWRWGVVSWCVCAGVIRCGLRNEGVTMESCLAAGRRACHAKGVRSCTYCTMRWSMGHALGVCDTRCKDVLPLLCQLHIKHTWSLAALLE